MSAVAATAALPGDGGRSKPYRVAELATLWDVDPSTVYKMISSGILRVTRHGPRRGAIRVPVDAVAEYERSATSGEAVA